MVVEELLQLFIGEVDAQLLKRVDLEGGQRNKVKHVTIRMVCYQCTYLEDLKTSNVKYSNEEVLASL